jgi:hypothetical protein
MKEVGDAFEKWTYKANKRHARVPIIAMGSWHFITGHLHEHCYLLHTLYDILDHEQLIQQPSQINNNGSVGSFSLC